MRVMCARRCAISPELFVPFKLKQKHIRKIVLVLLVLFGGGKGYQTSFESTPIGQEVSGLVVHVADGDTIRINGVKIRLWGVDAPEKGKPGWSEAGDFLRGEIGFSMVSCLVHTHDKYGRLVAQCTRENDDTDVGALIISAGWARDYMRYSKGYYKLQELQARKDGKGIWG